VIPSISQCKGEGNRNKDILANDSPSLQASTTLPAKVQFHKIASISNRLRVISEHT